MTQSIDPDGVEHGELERRTPRQVDDVHVAIPARERRSRDRLFVIIAPGESVMQVVTAASEVALDGITALAGLVAFAMLATVFTLSVKSGCAGVPHLRTGHLVLRFALPLHAATSATIVTLAVGLARVVTLRNEPPPYEVPWLLCATVALLSSRQSFTPGPGR